ncbi:MAG TPA: CapA family protein [Candidatus Paceibacterota bacterium]|nr:CapA family protein [Candidatus Paceibacterota bacterium]
MTFFKEHAVSILAVPLVSVLLASLFFMFPIAEHSDVSVASAEPAEEQVATFVFVGDIMLDRYIRQVLQTKGSMHVFGGVRDLLEQADVTAGNLEGPITDSASVSGGTKVGDLNNMRFTFPVTSASMLSSLGFDLVSIGNNHMRDFGASGVESTKRHLTNAGIAYIGDPNGADIAPVVREVNGIKAAFVGYNEFLGWQEEWTMQGIRDARRSGADLIVVMAHWGEEYTTEPAPRIDALLTRLKDAGANLVIGTHPHVIGSVKDMDTLRAYYSLGNFVFDQYWNEEVSCGLVVTVTATKVRDDTTLSYKETRVKMERDGRTVIGCETPSQTQDSPS